MATGDSGWEKGTGPFCAKHPPGRSGKTVLSPFPTLFLPLLLTCAGCGSDLVTVEGKVTFDGQPVEKGSIVLEPADGQGSTAGGEIKDGEYVLSGDSAVQPGKKIVRITAVRKTGRKLEAGPPSPPGTIVEEVERYIPPQYNRQSTLTCEVTAGGTNEHDFPLKSP